MSSSSGAGDKVVCGRQQHHWSHSKSDRRQELLCKVPLISANTDTGTDKEDEKLWEMDHQGMAHRSHVEAQAFLNMLGGVERVYHWRVDFVRYRLHFWSSRWHDLRKSSSVTRKLKWVSVLERIRNENVNSTELTRDPKGRTCQDRAGAVAQCGKAFT